METRVMSPSLVERSIHRLLSLEPASPPAIKDSNFYSNSFDFELDSVTTENGGSPSSSFSPYYSKPSVLPPIEKPAHTKSVMPLHQPHSMVIPKKVYADILPMKPVSVKSFDLPLSSSHVPYYKDNSQGKFDSTFKESDRQYYSPDFAMEQPASKLSITAIGLPSENSGPYDHARSGYIFKPVTGKLFSKSVQLSAPSYHQSIELSTFSKIGTSSLSLSPLHTVFAEESFASGHSVSPDGIVSRSSGLQVGISEEESRLPSPNLQVPMLPIHTQFDDEGFLSSEYHSEREPLSVEQNNAMMHPLDNPFSLDISEKPPNDSRHDKKHAQISGSTEQKGGGGEKRKRTPLAPAKFWLSKSNSILANPSVELHTSSTVSTLGEVNAVPFAVHKRVLGWKLTSVEKRRELVDIMDAVHGSASPDQKMRLRKNKLLRSSINSATNAQLAAFGASQSLPELRKSLTSNSLQQLNPHMIRSKTRQSIAYEEFVTRSVSSRQGFRNVQQIKNYVEDQRKKKEVRDAVIAEEKARTKPHQPFVADLRFLNPTLDDPSSNSITVQPYIPVGTLTASDKFGKNRDDMPLRSLLAEALFAEEQREEGNKSSDPAPASSAAQRLYNYPVAIHRPRSRMEILDAVKIRQEIGPVMGGNQSFQEDVLVDAFIAGRQNARLRRSRDHSQTGLGETKSKSSYKSSDLLGDNWDDESILSLSTSAEENEQALSEALMENFGISLHDDNGFENLEGDYDSFVGFAQGSAIESDAGNSNFFTPSFHPPHPLSSASSVTNNSNPAFDDDASWPGDV